MKNYGLNELREMFLSFFESKGHLRLPSFSLVPQGDKSLLLINSGMAPMKPWFTGEQKPPRLRVTTCQKCVRTGDIENIGKTARHGTYFEMLGNFSFGDYFKSEAIAFCWEFLTEVVGMEPELLYPSVYEQDDDAFEIWNKEIGIPAEKITRLGKGDNFWEHGAGPCGPCSEVYYDRGVEYGCDSPDCGPGCDCDRYIEIWNNVFTQFDNDGRNNYTELKQKNIDTGMGLERLAVVCQGVDSLFDVDTVMNITNHISRLTGAKYGESHKNDVSLRIITDHTRASVMLISDGVLPSNEGRGYVLRRLLRRAARHGRLLGTSDTFLHEVAQTVIGENVGAYPELRERESHITRVIRTEEENFNKTLGNGLDILNGVIASLDGATVIPGEDAFRLYDTYGFPIDLTIELAEEKNLTVDTDKFNDLMKQQRERAREARKALGDLGWEGFDFGADNTPTEFVGYDKAYTDAKITAIIVDGELVDALQQGDEGIVVLDKTTLYAEMGGQVGDKGSLLIHDVVNFKQDAQFNVGDTQKTKGGKYLHHGVLETGTLKLGDEVEVVYDGDRRNAIRRAHSATHLLHAALRKVLGDHVTQAGSLVEPDSLRFDFTHFQALSPQELRQVEAVVSGWILLGSTVTVREMPLEEAKTLGATALFGEKYGDTVRVVSVSGKPFTAGSEISEPLSIEFCGGTHLDNTAKVGSFRINAEFSVASGVRRIEAVTGHAAISAANADRTTLGELTATLKVSSASELAPRIEQLNAELRELRRAVEAASAKAAVGEADSLLAGAVAVGNVRVIAAKVAASSADDLRTLGDALRDKDASVVAVLTGQGDGKLSFLAVCGKDAVAAGVRAGDVIKHVTAICGGSGGGKPDSAMGGGKDVTKLDDALASVAEFVKGKVK
ncbi:MAG: alanine--tRNA ligase [Oscillospiraceae bacterium]|jgi:alanyl-tRNA synthetase|nr:alanine--tRNA ligase [Oscillospiraceae bacterium]